MTDMIERVALAILPSLEAIAPGAPGLLGHARSAADSAIAAMREPTAEMGAAGTYAMSSVMDDDNWNWAVASDAWRTMIDEAIR